MYQKSKHSTRNNLLALAHLKVLLRRFIDPLFSLCKVGNSKHSLVSKQGILVKYEIFIKNKIFKIALIYRTLMSLSALSPT